MKDKINSENVIFMLENLIKLNDAIEKLDLTKDNSIQISSLIKDTVKAGLMPFFYYSIPKKTIVLRARRNRDSNEEFWFPQDLSFRRDIYNIKEFQRATIPKHTSFYATFGVSDTPVTDSSMRVVMLEALPDLNTFDGYYTIGLWEFVEDLSCLTIIDEFYQKCDNPVLNDVHTRYNQFLFDHPETKDELIRFNKIMANEFKRIVRSPENEKNHLLYQVSGTVGTILQQYNFGVVYPTAKVSNYPHSLNVAIPWRFADSKLKIKYAGMFRVNVENDNIELSGIKECMVIDSVINDSKDNNKDILSGNIELQWKEKEDDKYHKYF